MMCLQFMYSYMYTIAVMAPSRAWGLLSVPGLCPTCSKIPRSGSITTEDLDLIRNLILVTVLDYIIECACRS